MKKVRITLVIAAIFVFSSFGSVAFATGLGNDAVFSEHIKEADGTTGQDTNSGSGVKTGHIQDGAVTTGKIADGAATTTKLVDGAVTTPKIADGAVTDAKITGPISGSKISPTGLNADTVDGKHDYDFATASHNHDGVYQKKYAKVAVVAQGGGDYADPLIAMNNVNTWCGTPSTLNPCLLKIMPGVYDIGANTLNMAYVDLEGSGRNSTVIKGSVDDGQYSGVIKATVSAIRFLTVENIGGGTYSTAIYTYAAHAISDVTAIASGGTYNRGIFNHNGAPLMTNVEAAVSGGGSNYGIYNYGSNPRMVNVVATASNGSSSNYGIGNWFSSPLMMNVEARAVGNSFQNTGIINTDYEGLMMNIIAAAEGGNNNIGMYNQGINGNLSSITIRNAVISASGGVTADYGIMNTGTKDVAFKGDQIAIIGSTATIYHGAAATFVAHVGNSSLEGGAVIGNGTITCAGVYDENYVFYANTCP